MTEIKIPFTKKSIRNIPDKDLNAGSKGVELQIQTDFLMSQLSSLKGIVHPVQDAPFEKIAFVFKDNAEPTTYDTLLDNKNQSFELSFDKEKIFLMVFGFGNVIDKTKPEVQFNPGDKSLVVFLESEFAGIITLESKDNEDDKKDKDDKKDNAPDINVVRKYSKDNDIKKLEYDEETGKLVIFYKSNKPKKEVSDLDNELQEIKKYLQKNGRKSDRKLILEENDWKENSRTQSQSTNYTPYWVAGGIGLFVIVLIAVIGLVRKND